MLSEHNRWLSFYEFIITPTHDDAPLIPMTEIAPKLESLFNSGDAIRMYSGGNRAMRISDCRYDRDNGLLTLLIQLADKRVSDPVFSNLESGALRVEPKLDGEGIAVSCHVVIKTVPSATSVNFYRAIVEVVPGITRSVFEPFLKAMLKDAYDGEMFTSSINNKEYQLRPTLKVASLVSKTLEESLAGSSLVGMRLVKTSVIDEMDQNPYTEVRERSLKLGIKRQPSRGERGNLIEMIRGVALEDGYNKLIINYRKDGKQSSLDIEIREDATDQLFTKLEKVILPDGIAQCEEFIHNDLTTRMSTLINA
ncbi:MULTISPECIES: hypothetical protein [Gammaproteobacteria]|uniref:hypothetical protein n=1 Tax=Gammaproteobacteria TaxID=1236 RepID=UPI00202473EA|nr:hypothetical protein [Proteus mirabilis]MCL8556808.1 hypothetical protein [Proteus mirabilis]MCL8599950.1 hypothetical protein [Proteus mirabilis]MDM3626653.1 hypothetical protein [Proteus mirabilis]WGY29363.1 hypothetical protein QJS45_04945 [Proteus mirabilis]WSE88894.1 hypothetical protein U1F93_06725 [Proteus mirabilis]